MNSVVKLVDILNAIDEHGEDYKMIRFDVLQQKLFLPSEKKRFNHGENIFFIKNVGGSEDNYVIKKDTVATINYITKEGYNLFVGEDLFYRTEHDATLAMVELNKGKKDV